jgi:hypothetical protein
LESWLAACESSRVFMQCRKKSLQKIVRGLWTEGFLDRNHSIFVLRTQITIIFFDLPVVIPLWRMAKRYFEMRGRERPDVGSGNKQQHPFTRADIKYAINYPRKDIHEKLAKVGSTKHVFVVRRSKDIATLLNSIDKIEL